MNALFKCGRQIEIATEERKTGEGGKPKIQYIESCVLLHGTHTVHSSHSTNTFRWFSRTLFHHHVPFVILPHFRCYLNRMKRHSIASSLRQFLSHAHNMRGWSMRQTHTNWHSMKRRWILLKISLFFCCWCVFIPEYVQLVCMYVYVNLFAVLPTWNDKITLQ